MTLPVVTSWPRVPRKKPEQRERALNVVIEARLVRMYGRDRVVTQYKGWRHETGANRSHLIPDFLVKLASGALLVIELKAQIAGAPDAHQLDVYVERARADGFATVIGVLAAPAFRPSVPDHIVRWLI